MMATFLGSVLGDESLPTVIVEPVPSNWIATHGASTVPSSGRPMPPAQARAPVLSPPRMRPMPARQLPLSIAYSPPGDLDGKQLPPVGLTPGLTGRNGCGGPVCVRSGISLPSCCLSYLLARLLVFLCPLEGKKKPGHRKLSMTGFDRSLGKLAQLGHDAPHVVGHLVLAVRRALDHRDVQSPRVAAATQNPSP